MKTAKEYFDEKVLNVGSDSYDGWGVNEGDAILLMESYAEQDRKEHAIEFGYYLCQNWHSIEEGASEEWYNEFIKQQKI